MAGECVELLACEWDLMSSGTNSPPHIASVTNHQPHALHTVCVCVCVSQEKVTAD